MRYLAMIFAGSTDRPAPDHENRLFKDEYARFNREAKNAGVLLGGEALQPAETATVVRMTESGAAITDDPLTGSNEALGGFYMLECENLDQALEWAARIPDARCGGAIEVRPILELNVLDAGRPL